jgi:hypothetical protein
MWRQPRRLRQFSLIWTKSSATGSWCRSLVKARRTGSNSRIRQHQRSAVRWKRIGAEGADDEN